MEVLEYQHQRLVQAFAQQNPLDRLERAPPTNLRIHLGKRIGAFHQSEQPEQIRQRVFQCAVERDDLAVDLFAARADVIFGCDAKIRMQQFDQWKIRGRLTVRDRVGLQHRPTALVAELELIK